MDQDGKTDRVEPNRPRGGWFARQLVRIVLANWLLNRVRNPDIMEILLILAQEIGHTAAITTLKERLAGTAANPAPLQETTPRTTAANCVDISAQKQYIMETFAYARLQHEAGRLAEAEQKYLEILKVDYRHADSLNDLAIILFRNGKLAEGITMIVRAIQVDGSNHIYFNNYGNMLQEQGRFDEAATQFCKAIAIMPNYPQAYYNLGLTLQKLDRLDEAIIQYRETLRCQPEYPEAHNNLGLVLQKQGKLDDAIACYTEALRLKPASPDVLNNLGTALQEQGKLDDAEARYRQALAINPDDAEAYRCLGGLLKVVGRTDEAEACYRRALVIRPSLVEVHNSLGNILRARGQLDQAEACYRQALTLKPEDAQIHSNLGLVLKNLGRFNEAEDSYRRALSLAPEYLNYAFNAELLMPEIYQSSDDINYWRGRYADRIDMLMSYTGNVTDPTSLNISPFYLACHNYNNCDLTKSLTRLLRTKSSIVTFTAPHISSWRHHESRRRIRVGIISQFLRNHTIGKVYSGLIRHLDRMRFEVVLIHTDPTKSDDFTQLLNSFADRVLNTPGTLIEKQQMIADAEFDVLFYPDIGMSQTTYILAYSRLAPVQVVSIGHPETTGLDTIDYFISATSIEPADADSHYSERLICLNRIPFFYPKLFNPPMKATRSSLGLPPKGTLYCCPHTLFKFHPDFDAILSEICDGDPAGHLVLIDNPWAHWKSELLKRWHRSSPALVTRTLFLNPMTTERYIELMSVCDVVLNTIHFGGGTSFYDTMYSGTPVVIWPGRFLRGRIAAGAYKQMELTEAPVVDRREDYAPLALELGRNPDRNKAFREASVVSAHEQLFADMRVVREFETFLDAAVTAAGQGERLPMGWRPA